MKRLEKQLKALQDHLTNLMRGPTRRAVRRVGA
jgi:hypothetical protein